MSLVSDSIYDQVVPEIYTDSEMPVNCRVAAGRDESDFYEALGIVGEGPLISYTAAHYEDRGRNRIHRDPAQRHQGPATHQARRPRDVTPVGL